MPFTFLFSNSNLSSASALHHIPALSRSHHLPNLRLAPLSSSSSSSLLFTSSNGAPSAFRRAGGGLRCSLPSRPEYIPNRISDPHYVRIFDTTLSDCARSGGATILTSYEKLVIARQLSRAGVDIIEAGFPAYRPDDLEAVRSIALEVGNLPVGEDGHVPVICALAECNKKDIDAAWEAVRHAKNPRVHTFITTSEISMQQKTSEEVMNIARDMVAYAKSLGCQDIEFSPEDASRSDREFLYCVLAEVIKAGATTLSIADTYGYALPTEFGQLIAAIKANTPGIENVIISTHCLNHLGLATANTLAGACAGARQLKVTINGIGEVIANASLEEVIIAMKFRQELLGGLYTGINTKQTTFASKLVAKYVGMFLQRYTATFGANLFPDKSGIHQRTSDKRLEALISDEISQPRVIWYLDELQTTCGTGGEATATVKLSASGGEEKIACSVGSGPVDAAFKAIDSIVQVPNILRRCISNANPGVSGAKVTTEVVISGKSKHAKLFFSQTAFAEDIVVSNVQAYLAALNEMAGVVPATKASEGTPKGRASAE